MAEIMTDEENQKNLSRKLYSNLTKTIEKFYNLNKLSYCIKDIYAANIHATMGSLTASIQCLCEISENSSEIKDLAIKNFITGLEEIK